MANINENTVKLIQSANLLEQEQQKTRWHVNFEASIITHLLLPVQKDLVFSKRAVRELTHCKIIMRFRHKIQILNKREHPEENTLAHN